MAMTPRYNPDYDKVMIGIAMAPLRAGQLPVLPGVDNALVQAGVVENDILVSIDAGGSEDKDLARTKVISGAERIVLPLSEDIATRWRRIVPVSALSKMFGASQRPPPLAEMLGHRFATSNEHGIELQHPVTGVTCGYHGNAWVKIAGNCLAQLQPDDLIVAPVLLDQQTGLEVIRGGEIKDVTVPLNQTGIALGFDIASESMPVEHWYHAFGVAWRETNKMVTNTAQLIPRFFSAPEQGGVDASKSLHGPVGIFREMKARAEKLGFASFLHIVALLGINLFLLNLLPIPLVDGGRLLFIAIEAAIRRPLPEIVGTIANSIGLGCILLLMVYVLGLDILRLLGQH